MAAKIFDGDKIKFMTKPAWRIWLMSLMFWKYQQVWLDGKLLGLYKR